MSWILGITGEHIPEKLIQNIRSITPPSLFSIQKQDNFYVTGGGNSETLHSIDDKNSSSIIVGSGLSIKDGFSTILTTADWKAIIEREHPDLRSLNGHFVIIRFKNNVLECFSDRVGLRTLYFAKLNETVLFSTKLSWISKLIPEAKIDWKIFGGRWISLQQFSFDSAITNTFRIPPNGYSRVEERRLTISSKPWIEFSPSLTSPESIVHSLRSIINVSGKQVALGLSGGFDSRLLFALLLNGKKDFYAYSFGYPSEPDVAIAKKIAGSKNVEFKLFSNIVPSQDECLRFLQSYVEHTNCVGPASEAIRLNHYHKLRLPNSIMIDGGNGELLRRQFMYRFAVQNKNDILQFKIANIASRLSLLRANIFNAETLQIMQQGVHLDIERSIHSLPKPKDIGLENFLDLWIATTRIPNIGSEAQPRIDEDILNFMPFTQPDFIISVLQLPLRYRTNSSLFRETIFRLEPSMTKFPLVKNNISYPYSLSTLQARIWTTIKSKLSSKYDDPIVHAFLETIKEFVVDTVNSTEVKQYSQYDHKKIQSLVERYYGGEKRLASEVNWWIAFDVWRKMVEK